MRFNEIVNIYAFVSGQFQINNQNGNDMKGESKTNHNFSQSLRKALKFQMLDKTTKNT